MNRSRHCYRFVVESVVAQGTWLPLPAASGIVCAAYLVAISSRRDQPFFDEDKQHQTWSLRRAEDSKQESCSQGRRARVIAVGNE